MHKVLARALKTGWEYKVHVPKTPLAAKLQDNGFACIASAGRGVHAVTAWGKSPDEAFQKCVEAVEFRQTLREQDSKAAG
ncbi:MAG: hypothetical protein ABFE08_05390 [Armatimonadia bacterium]